MARVFPAPCFLPLLVQFNQAAVRQTHEQKCLFSFLLILSPACLLATIPTAMKFKTKLSICWTWTWTLTPRNRPTKTTMLSNTTRLLCLTCPHSISNRLLKEIFTHPLRNLNPPPSSRTILWVSFSPPPPPPFPTSNHRRSNCF